MSAAFEVQWEDVIARLRRRLQAGGKVIALNAFLSARKEALPLLESLEITPDMVKPDTHSNALDDVLTLITEDRIRKPIRRGLAKKFLTALLEECTKEPVTDEEVEAGIKKGQAEHEAAVEARRAERAERAAVQKSSDADSGADSGDADAAEGEDADEEQEGGSNTTSESSRARHAAETQEQGHPPHRAQHHHSEDEMNEQNDNDDETLEDEEAPLDEVDTQPPSRRARPQRIQQPQVVYVQPPPPPRAKTQRPQSPPRNSFFPSQDMVCRIYKRAAGGRRSLIGEYTKDDIGGMSLPAFVKEYIDPENNEPTGRTTYECIQVDSRSQEVGRAYPVTIESAPQEQGPLGQVREVFDLFQEMRAGEEEKAQQNNELLGEMKKKAMSNNDFGPMMMLFMMERMMAPPKRDEETMFRVLEKMGIGKDAHSSVPMAAMPMPMSMPMPLPPPVPAPSSALDKLMEASIAAMLKPAPSFFEQLREMQAMQQLMHPPQPALNPELTALLRLLAERQAQPKEVGAIDGMMLQFEKLNTMVKTLAPQMNMGGWAAPIQGILGNPEVQKALANVVGGIGGPPVKGTQPQLVAQQPQQPAPIPLTVQQQPQNPKPTPEMLDAAKKLAIAQTLEFRVAALQELLTAMYMSPTYQPVIEPVLKEAMEKGNVLPAQQFIHMLLTEVNPSLATMELVNATLRSMAMQAGEQGKKTVEALDKIAAPTPTPASSTPGTIETPNAKVIPINGYEAQIEAARAASAAEKAAISAAPTPPVPHVPEKGPEKTERAVAMEKIPPTPPETPEKVPVTNFQPKNEQAAQVVPTAR